MIKIVSTRGIIQIIALFAIVILFGFAIANAALSTSKVSVISNSLNSPQFTIFAYILDGVIFSILLLIALHRHHSETLLFRALEFIVIAFTSFFFFLLLYAMLIPPSIGYVVALPSHITYVFALPRNVNLLGPYVLAFASAIVLITVKELHRGVKDIATMVSSMGIGILLGINFSFVYAMVILAVVAVYDYITIFRTKAMVTFDKKLIAMDIAFLISVSDLQAIPRGFVSKKDQEEYEKYLVKEKYDDDPRYKKILKSGRLPIISQVCLGEGDLSLPLMAAISAFYTFVNYTFTGIIIIGAMLGVMVTMVLLKRYKKPLPAIPPLFAFISIAAGVAYAVTGKGLGLESIIFMAVGMAVCLLTIYSLSRNKEQVAATVRGRKTEAVVT